MTADKGATFTKTLHRTPYPAISPSRPELSQHGRVVLVTGSSEGIGYAIAKGFAKASAATVIMTGRRESALTEAVNSLKRQFPETDFVGCVTDASDENEVERFWKKLDEDGLLVDVLVLNVSRVQTRTGSLLEFGYKEVWSDFVTNVGSKMQFADYFYHQKRRDEKRKLVMLDVSTMAIHDFDFPPRFPKYATSKNAGTLLIQQISKDVTPDDMQVISFHPGIVFTSAAKTAGITIDDLTFDDEDLSGHFAVWAASEEARFLHGRFVWAAWDVDELSTGEIRERIENETNYLTVGVVGLS
ncbi:hypothetical protein PT974_10499 [Cladobotryum mycophilum]|uniref:Short chain dehydrogenase n=1 Tax=Cladobotryum mycophilum TaxID=491253 RepID=A0ABR0SBH4_9HYPO